MALGEVKTGPSAGLKADATDASKVAAVEVQAAKETAEATELQEGQVCYSKPGEPAFNCLSCKTGKRINFAGGKFFIDPKDPVAEELEETLDYFVAQGILSKKVG